MPVAVSDLTTLPSVGSSTDDFFADGRYWKVTPLPPQRVTDGPVTRTHKKGSYKNKEARIASLSEADRADLKLALKVRNNQYGSRKKVADKLRIAKRDALVKKVGHQGKITKHFTAKYRDELTVTPPELQQEIDRLIGIANYIEPPY